MLEKIHAYLRIYRTRFHWSIGADYVVKNGGGSRRIPFWTLVNRNRLIWEPILSPLNNSRVSNCRDSEPEIRVNIKYPETRS